MTLHFLQIRLTDALTFIACLQKTLLLPQLVDIQP